MAIAHSTKLAPKQYQLLYSFLPPVKITGRPHTVNMMLVIQGILYILVNSIGYSSLISL